MTSKYKTKAMIAYCGDSTIKQYEIKGSNKNLVLKQVDQYSISRHIYM